MKNLLPQAMDKVVFLAGILLASVGVYYVVTEPEDSTGGWFCIILGAIIVGVLLYQNSTDRRGR